MKKECKSRLRRRNCVKRKQHNVWQGKIKNKWSGDENASATYVLAWLLCHHLLQPTSSAKTKALQSDVESLFMCLMKSAEKAIGGEKMIISTHWCAWKELLKNSEAIISPYLFQLLTFQICSDSVNQFQPLKAYSERRKRLSLVDWIFQWKERKTKNVEKNSAGFAAAMKE